MTARQTNAALSKLDNSTSACSWTWFKRSSAVAFLEPQDLMQIMEELLFSHPGLEFLKDAAEFQDKYSLTVVVRIFYKLNIAQNGTSAEACHQHRHRSGLAAQQSALAVLRWCCRRRCCRVLRLNPLSIACDGMMGV